MKMLSKSALSIAIVAAMAATSAQADQFIDDGKLNIHLRNYYKDQSKKTGTAKAEKDSGWAQAVRADYKSGYFADLIGVDLSAHYSLKLSESRGNDKVTDTGLFMEDSKGKGQSYGKVFGAVKVNLMGNGVAKYGRMVIDTPLLKDSDSRALPSTTEGLYADYSMAGVTVYGAYATKGSKKAQAGYEDYGRVKNGKFKKLAVKTVGAKYAMNDLKLGLAYGSQADVANSLYIDGSYGFKIDDSTTLTLGAQYGKNKAVGYSKKNDIDADEKSAISWHGLMAEVEINALTASISMNDVSDNTQKSGWKSAQPDWKGGDDETGALNYNSAQQKDFDSPGEKSFMYKVGYNFSDMVEGLTASALYIDGKIDEGSAKKDSDTSEYDVRLDYAVPALKGLKLTLRHSKYEKDAAVKKNDKTSKDTRIIATYDLAVF